MAKSTKAELAEAQKVLEVQEQMSRSLRELNALDATRVSSLHAASTAEEKISVALDMQSDKLRMINELKANYNRLSDDQKKTLDKITAEYNEQIGELKKLNDQVKQQAKNQDALNKKVEKYSNLLAKSWEYLMQSDKVIKETIKNLGMSGTKAAEMRKSFELSAGHVARMGGGLADVQTIMTGFADETGRARVLSAEMVEDIAAIGLGTGLGVEQATKLGAQFEYMGLDAKRSMEMVQGIVDTSERMGVNTTKVLKNMSDNFKKVNTYSFKTGSKGIAEMAMNAEKFKVDMKDALSAADAAKSLEGAIELAANLQIMGGEFAKTDPFEWMYLARNEPDKLIAKISEMTKGMVTFKKNSDGTFEKFISPADRQRLESVAKSLGISAEEMTIITQRRADLEATSRLLSGSGLTGREKELVQGAAVFNTKSGKFEVQLAGRMRDITTLTGEQAKSFEKEQVSLKKRAEDAQDFETALKATIEELKAALLPVLNGINQVLTWIRPIANSFNDMIAWLSKNDIGQGILKGAGMLMAAGFVVNKAMGAFTAKGGITQRITQGIGGGKTKTGSSLSNIFRKAGPARNAKGQFMKGGAKGISGKGMMGAGAGIGAAALGIGAGIGAAAAGIGLLADSMSKLDEGKAEILLKIVRTLGIVMAVGIGAAVGIAAIGASSTAVAPGLAVFGATILMIGAGIGLAAAGIGLMAMGFGKLVDSSKGAGENMGEMAKGMLKMAGALALFTVTGLGLPVFMAVMGSITVASLSSALMARNMEKMGTAMKGTKDDWIAVQHAITAIGNANFRGGGMLADLANLLKKPLKVEFADKNVAIVSDITLNIDGQKFMQKIYKPKLAAALYNEARGGQGTG